MKVEKSGLDRACSAGTSLMAILMKKMNGDWNLPVGHIAIYGVLVM